MEIELQEGNNFLAKGRRSEVFKMCFGLRGATTVNKAESFEEHDEKVGRRRKEDFPGLRSRLKKLPFPCQSLFI